MTPYIHFFYFSLSTVNINISIIIIKNITRESKIHFNPIYKHSEAMNYQTEFKQKLSCQKTKACFALNKLPSRHGLPIVRT